MNRAAVIAYMLLAGCAHQPPHPAKVAWSYVALAHGQCDTRAQIEVALDRTCALVVTANGEPPRPASIDAADCRALLDLADRSASGAQRSCTTPQPFMAGVGITLDDGHTASLCWDDPLASRLAALGDKAAPDWRHRAPAPTNCDAAGGGLELDLDAPQK
jgi:hypothetical protein